MQENRNKKSTAFSLAGLKQWMSKQEEPVKKVSLLKVRHEKREAEFVLRHKRDACKAGQKNFFSPELDKESFHVLPTDMKQSVESLDSICRRAQPWIGHAQSLHGENRESDQEQTVLLAAHALGLEGSGYLDVEIGYDEGHGVHDASQKKKLPGVAWKAPSYSVGEIGSRAQLWMERALLLKAETINSVHAKTIVTAVHALRYEGCVSSSTGDTEHASILHGKHDIALNVQAEKYEASGLNVSVGVKLSCDSAHIGGDSVRGAGAVGAFAGDVDEISKGGSFKQGTQVEVEELPKVLIPFEGNLRTEDDFSITVFDDGEVRIREYEEGRESRGRLVRVDKLTRCERKVKRNRIHPKKNVNVIGGMPYTTVTDMSEEGASLACSEDDQGRVPSLFSYSDFCNSRVTGQGSLGRSEGASHSKNEELWLKPKTAPRRLQNCSLKKWNRRRSICQHLMHLIPARIPVHEFFRRRI